MLPSRRVRALRLLHSARADVPLCRDVESACHAASATAGEYYDRVRAAAFNLRNNAAGTRGGGRVGRPPHARTVGDASATRRRRGARALDQMLQESTTRSTTRPSRRSCAAAAAAARRSVGGEADPIRRRRALSSLLHRVQEPMGRAPVTDMDFQKFCLIILQPMPRKSKTSIRRGQKRFSRNGQRRSSRKGQRRSSRNGQRRSSRNGQRRSNQKGQRRSNTIRRGQRRTRERLFQRRMSTTATKIRS